MTSRPLLLACPFCGGEPTVRVSFGSWLVECKCGADGPSVQRDLVPDAHGVDYHDERLAKIEAWNRRAHLAAGSGEGWVSVKDGLPDDFKSVLVFPGYRGYGVSVGYICFRFSGGHIDWADDQEWIGDEGTHTSFQPTHWQPLPPAPTGK